jgi:hypothetical protein
MHIIRKLALGVLSPLFIVLLLVTAFDVGFIKTATHPATVKKLISESGLYNSLVPSILQQNKTISTPVGDISATDPEVQKAVGSAVTPQAVQQNVEGAIDNIYQWLNGQVAQPTFKIDFSSSSANFANNIAGVIQSKTANLPTCSNAQSLAIERSGQFDAVTATCLPRGVSPASLADQVKSGLSSDNFFDKTKLSAADFKSSDSGQSVFNDRLKSAPKQYQQAKKTPYILAMLTILVGTGIVFLSRTRLLGLRHIGIDLAIVGVLILVLSWGLNQVVSNKIAPNIKIDNNTILQTDVRNLVTDIVHQVDKNYWFFGGTYTLLGTGSIIAAEVFRRRSSGRPSPVPAAVAAQHSKNKMS